MTLGKRLIAARERNGMQQNEAANALGMSNVVLNRYEKDERRPEPDTLRKLADFYGVTADYLVGRTDDPMLPERVLESAAQYDLPPEGVLYFRKLQNLSPETRKKFIEAFEAHTKLIEEFEKNQK